MNIAFTAKGKEWDSMMDPRFGRTDYIVVYNEDTNEMTSYDNTLTSEVAHGAGPKTAQIIFDLNVDVLITGNGPGGNAHEVLKSGNIKIYAGAGNMTLKEAYDAYKSDSLKDFNGETE